MAKRHIYLDDIPLDEARAKLGAALEAAGAAAPLAGERVPLAEALGRVTAEPVRALLSSPHFHCAAMDGYAVSQLIPCRRAKRSRFLRLGLDAFPVNTATPAGKYQRGHHDRKCQSKRRFDHSDLRRRRPLGSMCA